MGVIVERSGFCLLWVRPAKAVAVTLPAASDFRPGRAIGEIPTKIAETVPVAAAAGRRHESVRLGLCAERCNG
jgi:hypothetical protein